MCSILCSIVGASCHKPNHYTRLEQLLSMPQQDSGRPLLFITNNGTECRNCNAGIASIFYDEQIKASFPAVFILMPDKHEADKQYYVRQYSFIDPAPKMLFSTALYKYYNDQLPGSYETGGVFITNSKDTILLATSLKDKEVLRKVYEQVH